METTEIKFWAIKSVKQTKLLQLAELQISANFTATFKCKAHLFELVFSVQSGKQYLHIPTQTNTDIYL